MRHEFHARRHLDPDLYSQVVGKYRLARTPWINHSWHATFYVNARGLTTSLVPDGAGIAVIGKAADGRRAEIPLGPMSVAEFHTQFRELLGRLGGTPEFHGRPNEVPDPIPFRDDGQTRPYDAEAVTRFLQALVRSTVSYIGFGRGSSERSVQSISFGAASIHYPP
jgi:hypothetical protein